jgi:cytochrome c553
VRSYGIRLLEAARRKFENKKGSHGGMNGSVLRPLGVLLILGQTEALADELYAYGEYLSGECLTCHRLDDNAGQIPAIFGWPEDKFVKTLTMYKQGMRENAAMRNVAASLGDEEMAALARYFASQTPEGSAQ